MNNNLCLVCNVVVVCLYVFLSVFFCYFLCEFEFICMWIFFDGGCVCLEVYGRVVLINRGDVIGLIIFELIW